MTANGSNADIEKIIQTYSEADREKFTSQLLEVIRSSDVVKILDENKTSGPGTLREVIRVCLTLGKIDASLAWIVGVANSSWSVRSNFRLLESAVEAMERNRILAMVLGRPGSLKKDKASGNYILTGEWRYASGCPYSSFFFCLGAVENTQPPDVRVIIIPAEQLNISGSWHATGLRATQSVTISAKDIVIPESNMVDYARILSGKNATQGLYAGFFTGVLMCCLLGSMLGATEAGLEYVIAAVNKGPVAGSTYTSMSESGAIRAEIGRLRSTLDLYKRAAEYNADVIDKAARDPNIILTTQDRVDNRGRATLIMRGCVSIIQDLLWIYGSSGLDKNSPLERIWRDVNVGARHGGFSKFVPEEAVGMGVIGRDPKELTRMF